ncbi:MAG: UDP-3-O-(3-hydroxymyristoyl)glucosamine N-acyltransferase [Chitinophagales bacterium]
MNLPQKLKASDIAQRFDATLIGNPNNEIGSVNEIHKVTQDSITFVDAEKYYEKVLQSDALVILIDNEAECPDGKTLLVVDNPFEVYNTLALEARPFIAANASISPTAKIGAGTQIQPNVFVGNHVTIGKNCIIHPNVTIYDYTEIGDNCIIHANTTLGGDAFYYHADNGQYDKMHTIGKTIIENDVEIGSCCTVDSGVSGDTIIGAGSKLDNQIHIGHGTVIGKNCLFAAQVAIAGKTMLGDSVILYGKVGVTKGISLGDKVVVLASSNVGNDLAGGKTYFGSPAIEAREKWREVACAKQLPKIWKDIVLKER